MTNALAWHPRDGQGPVLTRQILAQWVAAHPGRGAFWADAGRSGTFLCDPDLEQQGHAMEDFAHAPLPAQIATHEIYAGWCSYDLPAAQLADLKPRPAALPKLQIRRYPGAIWLHEDRSYTRSPDLSYWSSLCAFAPRVSSSMRWPYLPPQLVWDQDHYRRGFAKIQQYLQAGDSYQVNLSQPLVAKAAPSPSGVSDLTRACASFSYLAEHRPAPHGALIDVDGQRGIVSNSPELLFSIRPSGEHWEICSAPIKGTRPRGQDPDQDSALARELVQSEKDAAEHLMIVDLLRNDLVRIARPGSVRAPQTPTLLTLPTVFHLETRILATLHPDTSSVHLWKALAPGGSVTGAPKRRSMRIIDELEQASRGIYCGSIWLADASQMWANLAIRTGEARDGALWLRSGGGVVLDSDADAEWQETLDKAQAFFGPQA